MPVRSTARGSSGGIGLIFVWFSPNLNWPKATGSKSRVDWPALKGEYTEHALVSTRTVLSSFCLAAVIEVVDPSSEICRCAAAVAVLIAPGQVVVKCIDPRSEVSRGD